jgi:hypothetical protein
MPGVASSACPSSGVPPRAIPSRRPAGSAIAPTLAGANVRAVGFEAWPALRALYYLACGLCWLVTWRAPEWSALVTLLESSVNVFVLIASLLARYYVFALQGAAAPVVSLPEHVINFLISGGAGTLAFHQSMSALAGRAARPRER